MLFKNFIYLNEDLLINLSKQLEIQFSYDMIETNQITKEAGIGLSNVSATITENKSSSKSFKKNKFDLYNIFEKKILSESEGIVDFDFTYADHIFPGQLICFSGKMLQPRSNEENIEMLYSLKENPLFTEILKNSAEYVSPDKEKIIDLLFHNDSGAPIYFSNDEKYIVISNVKSQYLDIPFEEFQELFEEDVKVILMTDRKYSETQHVILLDLLKDFFKIGREMKRKIPEREIEKYVIREKGPAIKGEILAILN